MNRNIRLERVYSHSRDIVWSALTDSRTIAAWLMENDFQPIVGHKFRFHTKPQPGFDGVVQCEVTEVKPLERLTYTWRGGAAGSAKRPVLDTVVRFTLEAAEGGTRVVLEHNGFEGFQAVLVSFVMGAGWKKILGVKLSREIERLVRGERVAAPANHDDCVDVPSRVVGAVVEKVS